MGISVRWNIKEATQNNTWSNKAIHYLWCWGAGRGACSSGPMERWETVQDTHVPRQGKTVGQSLFRDSGHYPSTFPTGSSNWGPRLIGMVSVVTLWLRGGHCGISVRSIQGVELGYKSSRSCLCVLEVTGKLFCKADIWIKNTEEPERRRWRNGNHSKGGWALLLVCMS
jgi:hypothetical protein